MYDVLIVWSQEMSEIRFIILKVDQKTYFDLKRWHGQYINACDNKTEAEMLDFFYNEGKFNYELKDGPITGSRFDAIVAMGETP